MTYYVQLDLEYSYILDSYIDAMCRMWLVEPTERNKRALFEVGGIANRLFDQEFLLRGQSAYHDSLLLTIRNVHGGAALAPTLWKAIFSATDLEEPILDYGCGVGWLLRVLEHEGYTDLYGYDISTHHLALMREVGVKVWDSTTPAHFGTIICYHVLEHVPHPLSTLAHLRSLSNKLYANCDESTQPPHIAPSTERAEVVRQLKENGEYAALC